MHSLCTKLIAFWHGLKLEVEQKREISSSYLDTFCRESLIWPALPSKVPRALENGYAMQPHQQVRFLCLENLSLAMTCCARLAVSHFHCHTVYAFFRLASASSNSYPSHFQAPHSTSSCSVSSSGRAWWRKLLFFTPFLLVWSLKLNTLWPFMAITCHTHRSK